MKTKKLVIPLILLIISWINTSQALQEVLLKEDYFNQGRVALVLPKLAMGINDTLTVPVDVRGLSNTEVYSLYLKIAIDTTIVQVEDVHTGSLTAAWSSPIWNVVNGVLRISHYGISPFTEAGNALNILFSARGQEGSSTELTFTLGALNEGSPQADLVDGRVFIGIPFPVISEIPVTTYAENDDISIPIMVFDPLDKALSLSVLNLPSQATFTDNGDGSGIITWESDYYSAGEYNMIISVINADNLTSQMELNLIVENIPQAPLFTRPFENITFNEDEGYEAFYLPDYIADSDLNQGDVLTVSLTEEDHISLSFTNNLISFSAESNWFGTETLTLIISDTYGYEISQQIEVVVENVNDELIQLQALPEIIIEEDYLAYTLNLNEYFLDIDNQLEYTIVGSENIDFSIIDSILSIQPHLNWSGTEIVSLVATEGSVINLQGEVIATETSTNLNLSNDLTLVVNPVNDAPTVINQLPEVKVLMNGSLLFTEVDNYFNDVDSELSYSFSVSNNVAIFHSDNSFQITPSPGWVGVERIIVTATDDYGLSVFQTLVVKVQAGFVANEDFNHSSALPTEWSATGGNWLTKQEAGVDWAVEANNPRLSRTQRLVSKSYDLSGIYDVEISFWHDLVKPSGVTAILQYSLNGFTYNNIEIFNQSILGYYSVALPQANNGQTVRFRWQYTSSTVANNYWTVDDFVINGVVGNYLPPAAVQDFSFTAVSPQDISFNWLPIENNFFNQYEISVMSEASITNQLFIWNATNDNLLFSQETQSTTISGLTTNENYYFAIRSSDVSGNVSAWSEIISAVPTSIPIITFLTANNAWFNTQSPIISLQIEDDFMIDASSLEYRVDQNNNNLYDEDEVWLAIENYSNNSQLEIELPLTFEADGMGYRVEVRCTDTQNAIYSYSGTNFESGITDDFSFNIDTLNPLLIEDLVTSGLTPNSVTLEWLTYNEDDFSHYEIYYANSYDLSLADNLYSIESDLNLNNSQTSTTTITGLEVGQRYWFAILTVDLAGNRGALSNIVTNVLASDLPLIYAVFPEQTAAYANSRQIQLSCKLKDAYGLDNTSVQYRFDANGNGVYDANEEWLNAFSTNRINRSGSNSGTLNETGDFVLEVQVTVNYLTDGEDLKFEFRAKDINGFGFVYSGSESNEGIADDWSVNIDSIFPTAISNILAGLITVSTAEIAWTSSQDANFVGYKLFFSEEAEITSADNSLSWLDYPALANPGTGQNIFVLPNLNPNTQYYLKVAAVDIAGNMTFSEEITFFTINDSKPKTPENLSISFQGSDLILTWDSVTEDINGNPLDDVFYEIYVSEYPEFDLDGSNYYDTAYENQFIFYGMGQALPMIFFKIQAISD